MLAWGVTFQRESQVCEVNTRCEALLQDAHAWATAACGPSGAPHYFLDLMDRVPTATVRRGMRYAEKCQRLRDCWMQRSCLCMTHGGFCLCEPVDVDFSGLPCVDFSPAGDRRGLDGDTIELFIVWARLHCTQQTPLVILENVPDQHGRANKLRLRFNFTKQTQSPTQPTCQCCVSSFCHRICFLVSWEH